MEIHRSLSEENAQRLDSLYQFLSRKYRIRQLEIKIDDKIFKLFTVEDIDELLDKLAAKDAQDRDVLDERLPYWPEVWPSSLALARYIKRHFKQKNHCRALEIGCGIGLVGMIASAKGADLLLTDYQQDALLFAELNWLVNLREIPKIVVMDWRTPNLLETYDLILASDVVYERKFFWPLIELFSDLLHADGQILLSEPNRAVAREFFSILEKNGFVFTRHYFTEYQNKKSNRISVYDIRKNHPNPAPD